MKRFTTYTRTRQYKDQDQAKESSFGSQFDDMFESMGSMFNHMSKMFDIRTEEDNKTIIKRGDKTIVIDKDGNVTINGKEVEKEEEKKPKCGDLEKLVDIPKIDDSDLFRNIPTKVSVDKNLTTPLTLTHLDEFELKLTKLESKLGGRIEKLLIAVAIIGMMSLATLVSVCMSL